MHICTNQHRSIHPHPPSSLPTPFTTTPTKTFTPITIPFNPIHHQIPSKTPSKTPTQPTTSPSPLTCQHEHDEGLSGSIVPLRPNNTPFITTPTTSPSPSPPLTRQHKHGGCFTSSIVPQKYGDLVLVHVQVEILYSFFGCSPEFLFKVSKLNVLE